MTFSVNDLPVNERETALFLVGAMTAGKCVRIKYNSIERVIEVHTVGINLKTHRPCVRAWQVEGDAISGEKNGWKLFAIDDIQDVQPCSTSSQAPRPGYRMDDSAMSVIFCEITLH